MFQLIIIIVCSDFKAPLNMLYVCVRDSALTAKQFFMIERIQEECLQDHFRL